MTTALVALAVGIALSPLGYLVGRAVSGDAVTPPRWITSWADPCWNWLYRQTDRAIGAVTR